MSGCSSANAKSAKPAHLRALLGHAWPPQLAALRPLSGDDLGDGCGRQADFVRHCKQWRGRRLPCGEMQAGCSPSYNQSPPLLAIPVSGAHGLPFSHAAHSAIFFSPSSPTTNIPQTRHVRTSHRTTPMLQMSHAWLTWRLPSSTSGATLCDELDRCSAHSGTCLAGSAFQQAEVPCKRRVWRAVPQDGIIVQALTMQTFPRQTQCLRRRCAPSAAKTPRQQAWLRTHWAGMSSQ